MLSTNPFVHVFALDFSKAFNTVRHATLLDKMARLDIPDEVYNWIVDFYAGRAHATKFRGEMSAFAELVSSVIQGSSLGPASYIVTAAYLRPQTLYRPPTLAPVNGNLTICIRGLSTTICS